MARNLGLFPCAVWSNLRWGVGLQSDLLSASSPPLGPQSDLCVPSLPLSWGQNSLWGGLAHLGYLHTARLVVLGIWRISCGGSARCTGAGGAGSAHFSFRDLLREGPCSTWRESDLPPEGWILRSTMLGVCTMQESSLTGTGSLWDFGWGMGNGDGAGEHLCSRQAALCCPGLNNSPSRCPPALPLTEKIC